MQPNSTERAVTISGNAEGITKVSSSAVSPNQTLIPNSFSASIKSVVSCWNPRLKERPFPIVPNHRCHLSSLPVDRRTRFRSLSLKKLLSIIMTVSTYEQGQYAYPHPDLTKLHQLALQHSPLLPPGSQQQQQHHHQQQQQQQQVQCRT